MRTRMIMTAAASLLVLGGSCMPAALAQDAQGSPGGHGTASTPAADCDRACLTGLADRYMAALVAHDPQRVPWAIHVKFTENNVPMRIGDGLWGTLDKQGDYKLYCADPEGGQVSFFGVVVEGSKTSVYGMRLKVQDRKISEVETLLARPREGRVGFPNPAGLTPNKPIFAEVEPAGKRATREQLVAIADSYFKTIQQNDGTVYAPFDKDCIRVEDGVQTANNKKAAATGNKVAAMGCEAQLKTGLLRFVTSIRDRRYPVVDVEHGLVLAATFFDHAGDVRTVTLTDGTTRKMNAPFDAPYSFVILELFKVRNGKIRQVEAVLEDVPYATQSAWTPKLPPEPPSTHEPNAAAVVGCDRTCLNGFADQYMAALLRHDPKPLPWLPNAKFTENNVPLQPGDGLWKTIDRQGDYKLYFADPDAGQAGFFGTVEEDGHAAVFSLRLRIAQHRIQEAETIVVRKSATSFAQPEALEDKPILSQAVAPEQRRTREQLISIANGYFSTLQQNDGTLFTPFDENCDRIEDGIATTHNEMKRDDSEGSNIKRMGCIEQFKTGYFRYVTRIRDRRYMLVDVERGLVFAGALFDHDGTVRKERLTDGRTVDAQFEIPWTWLIGELFKVQDGKLRQVEALVLKVPYNTASVWK
ncbi:MAG: hypothetical protein JWM63_2438 [Gammaproteobacteria bacterium]|jgi:hypothetical protein|nr:hypothetical protein [Gammaproteobacteria bacterium]